MAKSPVSVVQLSTGHLGGAGLAARRLHQQLLSDGVDSEFFCLERSNFLPGNHEYAIKRGPFRRAFSKIAILVNEKLSSQVHFSVISTNAKNLSYFRDLSNGKTRVLHFHNWQNLISQQSLLQLVSEGYPIVLTLHDERIATGGCHYKLDCAQNLLGCNTCPRTNQILWHQIKKNRKNIAAGVGGETKNIRLITPSEWLKSSVKESLQVNSDQITHLLNPLGPEWNSQKNFSVDRRMTNSKIKIGIATMSDSYIKHGELLRTLRQNSSFNKEFEVLFLRDFPQSESGQSQFWKEVDILLALSRADNSPNSIIEARSLGIPVLASKVGGIPEILGKCDMGLESQEHNAEGILKKLRILSTQAKTTAKYEDDVNTSHKFVKLYQSLLNNS